MEKHNVNIVVENIHIDNATRVSATFSNFDVRSVSHQFIGQVIRLVAGRVAKLVLEKQGKELLDLIDVDEVAEKVVAEIVADTKRKILQP
jgi:hypothetical protein